MIVVADAGPLNYLVLIEAASVLRSLYHRVLIPQTVTQELRDARAPEAVRAWVMEPPGWCEIRPDRPKDPTLNVLDSGEGAAIALTLSTKADRLLIDDWEGRSEAVRRQLRVTGTLGVLVEAHQRGLLDFEAALARLNRTNYYMSPQLVARIRQYLSAM